MPQSQAVGLPRQQEVEETDKTKHTQIEQTYENKDKRKVKRVPISQTVALPRHQEVEETDQFKHAQIEQTYENKGKRKVKGNATITSRSPSQTSRGRGRRQNQTSANRTKEQKALRLALSLPSKVIAILKGLKKQEQNNTRSDIKQIAS